MDQPEVQIKIVKCHKCGCELSWHVIDFGSGPTCIDCYEAYRKQRNDLGAQNELLVSALRAAREYVAAKHIMYCSFLPECRTETQAKDVMREIDVAWSRLVQIDAALEAAE